MIKNLTFIVILFLFLSESLYSNEFHNMVDGASKKNGFRVQIFASTLEKDALRAKTSAEQKLYTKNVYVYVEKDEKWFKVRVGDCIKKDDAIKLLNYLKESGYYDAWIVRTKVISN